MKKLNSLALLLILILSTSSVIFAQNKTAQDYLEEGIQLGRSGQFESALEALQKSAELDPKQAATHANMGLVFILLKRNGEAVTAYRKAVKFAPKMSSAYAGLCKALGLTQQFNEALIECGKAIELDGNSLDANLSIIFVYQLAQRSPSDILRLIERTLQKFPDNINVLDVAAEHYLQTKNSSRALELYERLTELQPQTALFQVKKAELYLNLEEDEKAIEAARKAIEVEPKNAMAHFFLGRVYFEVGQHTEAKESFRTATRILPEFELGWYYLSLSETRSGNAEEGIVAMRNVIEISPENFDYNREFGSMLSKAGRYEEAVVPLKKAVKLNPQSFEVTVFLGLALFESAQHEEGLNYLMKADRMRPGNPTVQMFLNVSRSRQEAQSKLAEMREFAEKNPQDLNVRVHLAETLGYAGKLDEAEPYIEEVLKMNSKDIRVYQTIGIVYSTAHKYDKAIAMFNKSLEIKDDPGAYLNLAVIYARQGKINDAINAYEKVLELKTDAPQIMKIYADLLRDNGRQREALAMYKRSLAMIPNQSVAIFNAGMLSARFGDLENARQYLETLKAVDAESAKTLARFIRFKSR